MEDENFINEEVVSQAIAEFDLYQKQGVFLKELPLCKYKNYEVCLRKYYKNKYSNEYYGLKVYDLKTKEINIYTFTEKENRTKEISYFINNLI